MLEKLLPWNWTAKKTESADVVDMPAQAAFQQGFPGSFFETPFAQGFFGGETIAGGIRNKVDYNSLGSIDYYSLRAISRKLFVENKYAGMALGRLSNNVINEGLKLESIPPELITGFDDEETVDWTDKTEILFKLYAEDDSVDNESVHNFSTLQKVAYMESLIEGDILVMLEVDEKSGLPSVKLVSGRNVRTAGNSPKLMAKGNIMEFGVELDKQRRHVAYHVLKREADGRRSNEAVRVLAKGRITGRPKAFLIYETPPPAGKVRGFPILTRVLQAIDQIETYAVYEMEAAKLNASLAMWVEKTKDRAGSKPLKGIAKKTAEESVDGVPRTLVQGGITIQELAFGEKPQSFDTKRPNVNFKDFKDAVIEDIAAALEIPPEILKLKFGNNFSASRQAEIEFKAYVRKARKYFSDQFNKKLYNQWLQNMVIKGRIQAKGYLESISQGDIFNRNGWQMSRWDGFVKQHVDILKEAKAYEIYVDRAWMTGEQAASEITGSSFRSNVKRQVSENTALGKAKEPLPGNINTSKSIVESTEEAEEAEETQEEEEE